MKYEGIIKNTQLAIHHTDQILPVCYFPVVGAKVPVYAHELPVFP